MLQVTNVQKTFRSGDNDVNALQDVSFTVPTGTFAAIIGKSGSGKVTLLSILGALDRPSAGSIVVDSLNLTKLSDKKLTRYRQRIIGFVFQQYNLIPNLT